MHEIFTELELLYSLNKLIKKWDEFTGGISAAFRPIQPPNGINFLGKPAGRVSEGHLLIDFIYTVQY